MTSEEAYWAGLGPEDFRDEEPMTKPLMKDATTKQRDDLKRCPFCGTNAIEKGITSDSPIGVRWQIMCGNPFCTVKCSTIVSASISQAEKAWQERND